MTQPFEGNGAEAVHAETDSTTFAAIAAVNRGGAAGLYVKSLGGGVGIHAESTGGSPALDGVASGNGAGLYAKSLGGGAAAVLDGDVHISGRLFVANNEIVSALLGAIRLLEGQVNALQATVASISARLP